MHVVLLLSPMYDSVGVAVGGLLWLPQRHWAHAFWLDVSSLSSSTANVFSEYLGF